MSWDDFLQWEQASRDTIDVKKIYVDIVEDLVAGILLSQIIFWHLPNTDGEGKLRVHREGRLWLAKGREDWWEECRISPKQFDRASTMMVTQGLLMKKTFKFKGVPTVHVSLNSQKLLTSVKWILTKGENGNYPKGKMDIPQRSISSITEITTESTTESTVLVGQGDPPVQPPENKIPNPPYQQILNLYHQTCTPPLPKIRELNPSRKQAVRNRWNGNPDIKYFLELFKKVNASDFLCGRTEKPWLGCNFDWIMKLQNFNKILEGNYDNDRKKKVQLQYSSPAHRPFEPEDD